MAISIDENWPNCVARRHLDKTGRVPDSFWRNWNGMSMAADLCKEFLSRGREVPVDYWARWDGCSDFPRIEECYRTHGLELPEEYKIKRKIFLLYQGLIDADDTVFMVYKGETNASEQLNDIY